VSADADSLEDVLDQIDDARDGRTEVSLDEVLANVGRRSFGPLLVLAGLVILAPVVGDVPGVPTVVALLVLVLASQLAFGRERFWIPKWLLERSVESKKLERPLRWLRKPARVVDRLLRPRLEVLIDGPAARVVAAACLVLAMMLPMMELVPFTANLAGLVLCAFGLALTARDGLFALLGVAATLGAAVLIASQLL
jgi:hypothetical protein